MQKKWSGQVGVCGGAGAESAGLAAAAVPLP